MFTRWERSAHARLSHAGVELALGSALEAPDAALGGEPEAAVVIATGARPHVPPLPALPGVAVIDAWAAIAAPQAVSGPVLIADWGGEWSGLDAAERLTQAGHAVTLACAATHPGETLHQYQRNLYLARLDEAGVAIVHHAELAITDSGAALRHVFSGRTWPLPDCATLVISAGRAPDDAIWPAFEPLPGAARAGDVLSPRSLEEAVLEGTYAAATASSRSVAVRSPIAP